MRSFGDCAERGRGECPSIASFPQVGLAKAWEHEADLRQAIGSTESGTGAAVMAMTARGASDFLLHSVQAEEVPELEEFLKDTGSELRRLLDAGQRVVVEGTQGFGLSLLQGGYWPKATSRDTTAAGFLAEAGLSPRDVDDSRHRACSVPTIPALPRAACHESHPQGAR
jgi:adenylosuccinate synthase